MKVDNEEARKGRKATSDTVCNFLTCIALVIPSAGGKSTAARRFPVLDIDSILDLEDPMVTRALHHHERALEDDSQWEKGNKLLWKFQKKWLRQNSAGRVRAVLLHSYEQAQALGFEDIHILVPSLHLHAQAMKERSPRGQRIARLNREVVVSEGHRTNVQIRLYSSWREYTLHLCTIMATVVEEHHQMD
ncbi:hypothetical protein FA10DRAFT_50448 [Acaromyces ingoldii]|uniref:Uncharacterized protein n=1 Tax=Acaromyces ingoldii TaxID=215250 RepID=A0A316YAJ3_9BASI|nr:hypothetical protein FA10DRAFT_50448 [Acaromyces ingoldii]PWN86666.1 hypothetical protein FA10DRAFT_50448 [Acaromyces ingoldii]